MPSITDISRHLPALGSLPISVNSRNLKERTYQIVASEIYVDIVDCGTVPKNTISENLRQQGEQNNDDHHVYGGVETIDEAVDLCREVYKHYNKAFSKADEEVLRNRADHSRSILLDIIVRHIYQG